MLLGVKYLHDNNIVHRDIKPENFLIDINNNKVTVKLTDFGLACYYVSAWLTRLNNAIHMASPIRPCLLLHLLITLLVGICSRPGLGLPWLGPAGPWPGLDRVVGPGVVGPLSRFCVEEDNPHAWAREYQYDDEEEDSRRRRRVSYTAREKRKYR